MLTRRHGDADTVWGVFFFFQRERQKGKDVDASAFSLLEMQENHPSLSRYPDSSSRRSNCSICY